jgi:hypothetical protein
MKYFREEMDGLPTEVRTAAPQTLSDLSPPCQMMVIWAKEPEFQAIIITRLRGLEDGLIEVHGPVENKSLLDYIESRVLSSDFVKLVGRDEVENFLARSLALLRNYYGPLSPPSPPEPAIITKTRIGLNEPYAVGWLIVRSLLKYDIKKLVSDCIKEVTSAAKPSPPTPPPEEKTILEGFGAYMRPPIWVGEAPKPRSFKEKAMGFPLWMRSSE